MSEPSASIHNQPSDSNRFRKGTVVRTDAKVCHVNVGGEVALCAPRGKLFETLKAVKNPIAVGDRVVVDWSGDPKGVEEVLPRRNQLSRIASSHDPREQVLASNVDQLFVVASLSKPGFSSNRTDRILAACTWNDIPATLIINKIDLAREGELEGLRDTYQKAGVKILETCATDGTGTDELAQRLKGTVSVLYGASGAGKSSLLNTIQPDLALRVGKISKYWKGGKHTTAFSQMFPLALGGETGSNDPHDDQGTWVIDTPGIRVFRLHGVNRAELRDLFPDFAPYQAECYFPNCTHDHEPDCAVYEAVEDGNVATTRYASYVEVLDELDPPPADDTPVEPPEGRLL